MTQSIDQAPNNNPDNNRGDDERRNHPELIQGSQDFFGGTPANLYDGPAPIDRDPRQKTKRNLIIAGSALAFTGIASTALYFGAKSEVRQIADEMQNPLPGNSAPVQPGQIDGGPVDQGEDYNRDGRITKEDYDLMPPSIYAELAEKVHVSDAAPGINKYLPSAWGTIKQYLTAEEARVMYMPDLQKPRSEWTDQDYYNNLTLGIWLASTQGTTQEQINEGKRTLASVISPDHSNFSTAVDMIGEVSAVRNVYEAQTDFTSRELKSGMNIDGVYIDENGGRLTKGRYLADGQISYDLFVNRSDDQGNVITILERSYTSHLVPELKGVF